jgi:hypothetical protein
LQYRNTPGNPYIKGWVSVTRDDGFRWDRHTRYELNYHQIDTIYRTHHAYYTGELQGFIQSLHPEWFNYVLNTCSIL